MSSEVETSRGESLKVARWESEPDWHLFVIFILGLVALAASYVPAQRATRADPMIALSHNT